MTPERVRRHARPAAVAALVLALGTAGCGSASEPSPPSGVDGLVIPTPDPDPDDFVARIDNSWLPLAPGSRWEYARGDDGGRIEVTVETEAEEVADVPASEVHRVVYDADGRVVDEVRSWYAQDTAGNVWLFGQSRPGQSWRAGQDGAEAGLAMPANPRLGDGWRVASAPGVTDVRAQVTDLDGTAQVPLGSFDDLVVLEVVSGEEEVREYYARDVGLVLIEPATGAGTSSGLVAYDEPR